ncbi:MAG: 1-deoxy-D-xylulose-5-phosphate reductoisomerase [Spirochaetales bacterium]|nr:1-deoxy-D-xylulose-5-phosphate reductoisomerase [Spirochaetales bacterium]
MQKQSENKKVVILGSTGSIGENTLDVIRCDRHSFHVAGLSCHTNISRIFGQAKEFGAAAVAVTGQSGPDASGDGRPWTIYRGEDGLREMLVRLEPDIVVNGIAGANGLIPSIHAISCGADLALANKETIVMGGPLVFNLARGKGSRIIPVDSEHSALFQLLAGIPENRVSEIVITASGGAFRDLPVSRLSDVTVRDALKHPTWNMGKKITIDSATMGNKGLEIIEAHYLFGMPVEKIKVVIHPQSLVHSLVRTVDGCLFAQISKPDMRMPIHYALHYPDVAASGFGTLDLAGSEFTFLPVDENKYPMLFLAYRAVKAGMPYPVVYNAANEEAVEAFFGGAIRFTAISVIVEKTLDLVWENIVGSIEGIMETDKRARTCAREIIAETDR